MNYILLITDKSGLSSVAVGPMDYDTQIKIGTEAAAAGKHVVGYPIVDAALYDPTA